MVFQLFHALVREIAGGGEGGSPLSVVPALGAEVARLAAGEAQRAQERGWRGLGGGRVCKPGERGHRSPPSPPLGRRGAGGIDRELSDPLRAAHAALARRHGHPGARGGGAGGGRGVCHAGLVNAHRLAPPTLLPPPTHPHTHTACVPTQECALIEATGFLTFYLANAPMKVSGAQRAGSSSSSSRSSGAHPVAHPPRPHTYRRDCSGGVWAGRQRARQL